jgi:hypothetical protein
MGTLRKFTKKNRNRNENDDFLGLTKEEFEKRSRRADAFFCQEGFRRGFTVDEAIKELPKKSSYARERGKGYINRVVKRAWRGYCKEHDVVIDSSFELTPSEAVFLDMINPDALADSMTVEANLLLLSHAVSGLMFLGWTSEEVSLKVGRYCQLVDGYKDNRKAFVEDVEVGQMSKEGYVKKLVSAGYSLVDLIKRDDKNDLVVQRTKTKFESCICDEHETMVDGLG